MANSMSGSSDAASKIRLKTPAFPQSRYRLNTVFQFPNIGGRPLHGLPVRAIHSTASRNIRLSLPLRPGSVGLPKQSGSILGSVGIQDSHPGLVVIQAIDGPIRFDR